MEAVLRTIIDKQIDSVLTLLRAAEPGGAESEMARARVEAVDGLISSLHRGGRIDDSEQRSLMDRLFAQWIGDIGEGGAETSEEHPDQACASRASSLERVIPIGEIVEPTGALVQRLLFLEMYPTWFQAIVRIEDGPGPGEEVPESAVAIIEVADLIEAELEPVLSLSRLPDTLLFCPTPEVEDDRGTPYRRIRALGPMQGLTPGEARHTYAFAPAPPKSARRLILRLDGGAVTAKLVPDE